MNSNEQLICNFYTSFNNLDAEGMQACYHDDIRFSDPAFPHLRGKEAGAMWAMLVEALKKNPADWKLEVSNIRANETTGSCRWEAHYTFSLTGRKVHNIIDAHFQFKDGKISNHTDTFDFYRWSRMAFGLTGILLGWAPFFRKKVQATTRKRLSAFLQSKQS
ncbi:MAG: nuclear transport factor 2 family protein [Flammeovirgaceae bacterium]|nr:MAG: nuclear transport factor 2 family protein [Flammeovirgaceae bacterium]